MIAVAIASILASIAIPAFQGYKERSRYSEVATVLSAGFKGQAARAARANSGTEKVNPGISAGAGIAFQSICYAPWDPGSSFVRQPTEQPYLVDESDAFGDCKDLGLPFGEALYFSYIMGGSGGLPAGAAWWNLGVQDLDGDGNVGIIGHGVVINENRELSRAGVYRFGDVIPAGVIF